MDNCFLSVEFCTVGACSLLHATNQQPLATRNLVNKTCSSNIMRNLPPRFFVSLLLATTIVLTAEGLSSVPTLPNKPVSPQSIVILGGAGRIGTAIATHLLYCEPQCQVVLVGRKKEGGEDAIQEIIQDVNKLIMADGTTTTRIEEAATTSRIITKDQIVYKQINSVWDETEESLQHVIDQYDDIVIHAAGPYLNQQPTPLKLAIQSSKCQVYVDISDPIPYLEQSLAFNDDNNDLASTTPTTALIAAGAFPGMSNVLAMEAANQCTTKATDDDDVDDATTNIQDVRFNYFTSGLGGSGVVNLYITNLGFGEDMIQYDTGTLQQFDNLSGKLLGQVNFFVPEESIQDTTLYSDKVRNDNEVAKSRVGTQTIFTWPFPEAATVPKKLGIEGNSYAGMGTAPHIWNIMLGILVDVIPRNWWRNPKFSKFMADFSQPLVLATDKFFLQQSGNMGETHAMRIDVTTKTKKDNGVVEEGGYSIVQAHDSFRRCVGQSCAEFALDCWYYPDKMNGGVSVKLPEQRYGNDEDARQRIIQRLTTTPGTCCYTGPVKLSSSSGSENQIPPPTDWKTVMEQARKELRS